MRVRDRRRHRAARREEFHLRRRDAPLPTEMPLANRRRAIAVLFRESGDGQPVGRDERRAEMLDDAALQPRPPMISPGEQRVPRRRAHAGGCVPIREAHPLRREPVDLRRLDFPTLRLVALHVAITEVIGEDDEDVGFVGWCSLQCGQRNQQQDEEEREFHGFVFGDVFAGGVEDERLQFGFQILDRGALRAEGIGRIIAEKWSHH